jgi:tRNA-(ms[2]io[6]A)-hydroxylase
LTENIKDEELKTFYRELMISEANHYTTFIGFARQLGDPEKVNQRWEEWLEYEAKIIQSYGNKETIHGLKINLKKLTFENIASFFLKNFFRD